MDFKLFFAMILTALSTNLYITCMEEIRNFDMRAISNAQLPTQTISIHDLEDEITLGESVSRINEAILLSRKRRDMYYRIILKSHADLNPTEKIHRIDNLEKLKRFAIIELTRATKDEEQKKTASKIAHYTQIQLDIKKAYN